MFEGFADVWTIVGLASDLPRDKAMGIWLAGERVVLFRDRDGAPAALIDRCPHRGVALSLGAVCDGEISCPFHGWRFAADGQNMAVPWNPDAKRERLGATALRAREVGGLLWVCTGEAVDEMEPSSPTVLSAPKIHLCAQSVVWKAHWARVMENMLDSPHVPFVHRKSFGRSLCRLLQGTPEAKMTTRWESTQCGASIHIAIDDVERPTALSYHFPNMMELTLDSPNRLFRIFAVCIPLSQTETRLLLITARNFMRAVAFDPLFRWSNRKIAEEDRHIVESCLPPLAPDASSEHSVASDAATLAFRRLYRRRFADGGP